MADSPFNGYLPLPHSTDSPNSPTTPIFDSLEIIIFRYCQ